MGEFAIGQSVMRREDPRLLRGNGRYFDDLKLADQVSAAIVRSPHAHADIRGIDAAEALKMSGVHAVLIGEDYRADGLGSLPSLAPYKKRDGSPMYLPPRPAIAIGRAMHVGIRSRWWSLIRSTSQGLYLEDCPRMVDQPKLERCIGRLNDYWGGKMLSEVTAADAKRGCQATPSIGADRVPS